MSSLRPTTKTSFPTTNIINAFAYCLEYIKLPTRIIPKIYSVIPRLKAISKCSKNFTCRFFSIILTDGQTTHIQRHGLVSGSNNTLTTIKLCYKNTKTNISFSQILITAEPKCPRYHIHNTIGLLIKSRN